MIHKVSFSKPARLIGSYYDEFKLFDMTQSVISIPVPLFMVLFSSDILVVTIFAE